MSSTDELNKSIGRLEGKVDMILAEQTRQANKDETMDARLRDTEVAGARNGMVGGGVITIALHLLKETVKSVVS